MANIYLSFLGLGNFKKDRKAYEYTPTVYTLNEKESVKTQFVQVAEIELIGSDSFDKVIIVSTQRSYETHFETLKQGLMDVGVIENKIFNVQIGDAITPKSQWEGFEKILYHINKGDQLTFDLTHGYRASSIILSAAINFLQKAKGIQLMAVYYGAFEANRDLAPIVDMKDFYIINEWAEGVSRLIEDADARKLGHVAELSPVNYVPELNDEQIIKAFDDLTNCIRNVDVNNVTQKANSAIKLVGEKAKNATVTGKILLETVYDKFVDLTTQEPVSGFYDKAYFLLQYEITKMLLEHKLFMQAYTVMRELIASIGMIHIKASVSSNTGRKKRNQYADVFLKMIEIQEKKWAFSEPGPENDKTPGNRCEELKPYYNQLKEMGIVDELRSFTKEMTWYRNGFDHAWTEKKEAFTDIEEKSMVFLNKIKEVLSMLQATGII